MTTARTIIVTSELATELAATVCVDLGDYPEIISYHGRLTPDGRMSLAYIGTNPGIVGFELIALIARRTACAAYRSGYIFTASDHIDEMRHLVMAIQSPQTEAVGRDLVYYWPTIVLVD